MRKDTADKGDFCPECVNGNEGGDEVTNQNPYDEEDCCSCCCCSCGSSESEVEETHLNPINSIGAPATGRALIQKKDLLSNLSIVRTNREQASIQNILQFVEAFTHSNNFLRRYYMQEDFCLQCVQDSFCDCAIRGMSNLNLNDSCACSACENDRPEASQDPEPPDHSCSDCPPVSKTTSDRPRGHNRRNRRRRRRPRNSTVGGFVGQRRRPRGTLEQIRNAESNADYDSECSECQRNRSETQLNKVLEYELCNCEDCMREAESGRLVNQTLSHSDTDNNNDCCDECSCNIQLCGIPNCKDCKMLNSNGSNCNGNRCDSECEECKLPQSEESPCECCTKPLSQSDKDANHQERQTTPDTHTQNYPSNLNAETTGNGSNCEPCDCEECRYVTECSDESCEECGVHTSKNKKS